MAPVKESGFPFGLAQGGESFDVAQDREPVERHVEPQVKPGMTGVEILISVSGMSGKWCRCNIIR